MSNDGTSRVSRGVGSETARPRKDCACTGVRWCARCLDARIRSEYRMDDPVTLPPLLKERPLRSSTALRAPEDHPDGRIHAFDLATQTAPTCPTFRGIRVYRDALSPAEVRLLLDEIDACPLIPAQSGKRKQHYGPKINFNKRKMNTSAYRGIPASARELERKARALVARDEFDATRKFHGAHGSHQSHRASDRAACRAALAAYETTDVFVLRYLERESSNLDFHCDDTFSYGEAILDVSLDSDSVMTFLRVDPVDGGARAPRLDCVRVPLPARSIAVLYAPARYEWEHAILPYDIQGVRTSITLRTLSETLRQTEDGQRVLEIARGPITGTGTEND